MKRKTNRRQFLQNSAMAGAGYWVAESAARAESKSPNEKLNIAAIGAGGKGSSDIAACAGENIVALCDIDHKHAAGTYKKFPKAKPYTDFRKMLENEKLDAVTVSTADHTHAVASIMAMKMGLHVFCQKPLTHDIYEARMMKEVAAKQKVATQMGNQGTSTNGLRRSVEIVQSGAIGKVREAHVWTNRPVWPQDAAGLLRHSGIEAALHGGSPKKGPLSDKEWDIWLGPAPFRPYDACYCPWHWRAWWDFGTGALGDMACHTANMPFMALKLGSPTSVEAESAIVNSETYPMWSKIKFEFPARGDLPPVKFTWYDGKIGNTPNRPSKEAAGGLTVGGSGSLLIGDKGMLYSEGDYGDRRKLLPAEKFKDYKPPEPTLPRSPGHHKEWLIACKGGPPAMSNFDYAAFLTETILLGNVAVRTGKKLEWDGPNLKFTNVPKANKYVRREYREGWTL